MASTVMSLRLGIIGLSEGNGHPYSWAAICNGYDPERMRTCPFPAIPEYLGKQRFPEVQIPDADVTHIWTQDRGMSGHVAECSRIPVIVDQPSEMIGAVDGVLLARDDSENHLYFAKPFLEAGLPVYVDKPFATELASARELLGLRSYEGQVYSCSALRYAPEFQITDEDRTVLGEVNHISATGIKSWEKYGVHLVEPALCALAPKGPLEEVRSVASQGRRLVLARWADGRTASFATLGALGREIRLEVFGEEAMRSARFTSTFVAFKTALEWFIRGVRHKEKIIADDFLLSVVEVLERGRGPN